MMTIEYQERAADVGPSAADNRPDPFKGAALSQRLDLPDLSYQLKGDLFMSARHNKRHQHAKCEKQR